MREGTIQIESQNMLPIIKKWLYSDKDIFLRELVANATDAIRKLQDLRRIGEAEPGGPKPRITITTDKVGKKLTVEDNGIGMTEAEVEKYITQVAFSGAHDFLERYKDKTGPDNGIIGHFGLGFYSAFMVADSVEIDTLSYKPGAKPVHWVSSGESTYQIGEGSRAAAGTLITLHISDAESEFLEEPRIRGILRKYCAFMPYEIFLNPRGGDADKPVNDTHPLWLKAPKDCTKEEYEKFYTELFADPNPPLFWIHLNVDYPFTLKGILYFPKQRNRLEVTPGQVKLYAHQVYIADNIKEVVPEYLLLLKGVIDCPDLPLNVSRSFLQNDRDVQNISKHIAKKVSDKLHEIFREQRDTFNGYWEDLAPFIKFGCIRDESFYDRVRDILLFRDIGGRYLTFSELPKDSEKRVFYVTDEAAQSQYVRLFKAQGQNAVVLGHIIDPHFISFLEYKEPDVRFTRIDSVIGDKLKEGPAGNAQAVIDRFKKLPGADKLTVRAERLKTDRTPALLLTDEYPRRMREMSRLSGMPVPDQHAGTTLVLNTGSDVVRKIPSLPDDEAALVCGQIYDLARLCSRQLTPDEMSAFLSRNVDLLARLENTPAAAASEAAPAPESASALKTGPSEAPSQPGAPQAPKSGPAAGGGSAPEGPAAGGSSPKGAAGA